MHTYIVSYDITHQLIGYLSIPSIVCLMSLNSALYQLMNSTQLIWQLKIIKCVQNKATFCHQMGYVQLLAKVPQFLFCDGFLMDIVVAQQIKVLDLYTRLNYRFDSIQSVINCCVRNGKNQSLDWFQNNNYHFVINKSDVDVALQLGYIHILDWAIKHGYAIEYSEHSLCFIVYHNQLKTLMALKKMGLKLSIHKTVIDVAVMHGRLNFLKWFKKHHYSLQCSLNAFDRPIAENNLTLLVWAIKHRMLVTYSENATSLSLMKGVELCDYLIAHGFTICCTEQTVDLIIERSNRSLFILKWMVQNHFNLQCESGFEHALAYEETSILDILKSNGVVFNYSTNTLTRIAANVSVCTLHWLQTNMSVIKYTAQTIDCFVQYNLLDVLKWFDSYHLDIKYIHAIDIAAEKGYLPILAWFKNKNKPLKYTCRAIEAAAQNNHVNVLDWFLVNDLTIKCNHNLLNHAAYRGHLAVLEWCKKHHYMWSYHPHTLMDQEKIAVDWFNKQGLNTSELRVRLN